MARHSLLLGEEKILRKNKNVEVLAIASAAISESVAAVFDPAKQPAYLVIEKSFAT